MAKYDEYGRPIKKSKSFFEKISTPKKRKYNYKTEEKKKLDVFETQIEKNNQDSKEIQKIEGKQEVDLTKFPVFLVYLLIFILGFFGVIIGLILYAKIKDKEIKGWKKLKNHIIIAIVLTSMFTFLSFFFLIFFPNFYKF